ncbi:hypothetical protein [Demequina sp. NBRC 110055]|uniref:hypothetical protein n=1 Tax=Demequina sp. NBRC 110055 TaxID=1570344 RepID=UPI000A056399|nr:hypothetical protein [Demequina sp. NBRC 110055]
MTTTVTTPRPKPLLGVLLGLLLGVVVSALLWILGVTPPDRLPLFGIVAVSIALTSWLTTLAPRHATGRFATAMVIAALCAGVALTGIPEYTGTGSLSSGCYAQATSSLEPDPRGPGQTSATDPFDVTQDDTVAWSASTDAELTDARPSAALMLGGFAIPLWNGQDPYSGQLDLTGEDSVAAREQVVRDAVGFPLTGPYHFAGDLEGSTGGCEADAYVRVAHAGAFVGTLAITLWALLGLTVVLIAWAMVHTARSLVVSRRHASNPTTDRLTTTGGTSRATFRSGSMAEQPEQVTGDPEAARRDPRTTADAAAATAAASPRERDERKEGRTGTEPDGSTREGSGRSSSSSGSSTAGSRSSGSGDTSSRDTSTRDTGTSAPSTGAPDSAPDATHAELAGESEADPEVMAAGEEAFPVAEPADDRGTPEDADALDAGDGDASDGDIDDDANGTSEPDTDAGDDSGEPRRG